MITYRPEILESHKNFNISNIVRGMRIGLSHYHLYSASLMLAKTIHNREQFREPLLNEVSDILLKGSQEEVKNLLRLWFTVFGETFKRISETSLSKGSRNCSRL